MPKQNVESGHKTILDSLVLNMPGVEEGKMFGYAAYYVGGKLFACLYGAGVGVKVPEAIAGKASIREACCSFPTSWQTENEGSGFR